MRSIFKLFPIAILAVIMLMAFAKPTETTNVKCLIQMVNYSGEGAYVVISLMNPEGEYEETLYVQGKDKEWYSDITEWWKFYGKRRPDIDAISGETIAGGERTVSVIKIPNDKIDAGYSIRFETAVEDQEYYADDVQFELTSENVKAKIDGKGFIRYIRMIPQ
ncbi:DUF2271 domain-containing protein [Leptobacterium flavescens]|uniref:DUF2271 domain-containing protein n=1 Tax=Leptobacterium flavescens TaxID=472055 RepID=A0A6P0UH92_9FLAO|nr:DUF2271 domain-containing protein [Leptobacterium flavescens]NER12614.1 DUF2271 domain-containing protein [Leptobacterium flavescens]